MYMDYISDQFLRESCLNIYNTIFYTPTTYFINIRLVFFPGDSTVYQLLERENGGEREIARESDTGIASV